MGNTEGSGRIISKASWTLNKKKAGTECISMQSFEVWSSQRVIILQF